MDEERPTRTRYRCSRCGFERDDIEAVIEHIVEIHRGDGQVIDYEYEPRDEGIVDIVEELLSRIRNRLFG